MSDPAEPKRAMANNRLEDQTIHEQGVGDEIGSFVFEPEGT